MAPCDHEFAELVARLDYPLLIVTATHGGDRAGCLIGFASQVSIDPPRFLACLSVENRTYRVACEADALVIHWVGEDQQELADLFGGETGDDVDKFSRCAWHAGPGGTPVLDDLGSWFAGRVLKRIDFGDHAGFLLEPTHVELGPRRQPLMFQEAKWI